VDTQESRSATIGLLILRLTIGAVFVIHGGQKLFVAGLPRVALMMSQLSVPVPPVAAVIVTLVEFVGGALLILGLFARPAAVLIAIDMLVAVLLVHLHRGFFNPGGFEYPLTLMIANFAIALLGAGAWSVDAWVQSDRAPTGGSLSSVDSR